MVERAPERLPRVSRRPTHSPDRPFDHHGDRAENGLRDLMRGCQGCPRDQRSSPASSSADSIGAISPEAVPETLSGGTVATGTVSYSRTVG